MPSSSKARTKDTRVKDVSQIKEGVDGEGPALGVGCVSPFTELNITATQAATARTMIITQRLNTSWCWRAPHFGHRFAVFAISAPHTLHLTIFSFIQKSSYGGDFMSADGSIVIEARIDDKKAQQELNRLNRKIQTLNDQIYVKQQQKMPLVEQARQLGAELDVAKAKLNEMQSAPKGSFTVETIKEQQETVRALQADWARVQSKVESYDAGIKKASIELDLAKERAGEIHQQLAAANPATQAMSQAMDRMQKSAGKFSMRLREVIRSALIFTVISQGLASLRDWLGKVIQTNDEAKEAIGRLKGALLTLAQPLIEVIIPAFTTLVNIISRLISAIARVVSSLFGYTAEESAEAAENLYNESNAIESVGDAAKKSGKALASFDTINKLSGNGTISGGAGATEGIKPIFDDFSTVEYKQKIDELTAYISGALLALGAILTFSGINIPLGLALMAAGAVGLATIIAENWGALDGPLLGAITQVLTLVGGASLVVGAILAFSGANIPLGIGLMIVGASALGAAVALNWGSMSTEMQKSITGILEILSVALLVMGALFTFSGANIPLGIGLMIAGAALMATTVAINWDSTTISIKQVVSEIALLLGSALLVLGAVLTFSGANLPLGIGLMIAGAVSLATAVALNWDAIVGALQSKVGTITAIVSTALLMLGAILVFSGAALPLGIALLAAGAVGLVTVATLNWNTIITELQGEIGQITAVVSAALLVLGIILCLSGVGIPLGIALIAAGAVGLVTVTAINWNAILDKLKEVWGSITGWFRSNVEKYLSLEYWKEVGSNILHGL